MMRKIIEVLPHPHHLFVNHLSKLNNGYAYIAAMFVDEEQSWKGVMRHKNRKVGGISLRINRR